jgi:4-amino-4-deoxychorismate lyase
MFLLNGKIRDCLNVTDRGLQYGDGLFETFRVHHGRPLFWQRHFQRLQMGCEVLKIPLPDVHTLKNEALSLCQSVDSAVLKLIITRGSGGRGYRPPEVPEPSRLFSLHPFPDYPAQFYTDGITVRVCQSRLGINPLLAGYKHLNRLEQVLARSEWSDPSIQEGLLLDINDHLIEGTMSNVFLIQKGRIITPLLDQCGIKGVIRQWIFDTGRQIGTEVNEQRINLADLKLADEVFVCNSVIGIWPVSRIADHQWPVGPVTLQLQHLLKQSELESGDVD